MDGRIGRSLDMSKAFIWLDDAGWRTGGVLGFKLIAFIAYFVGCGGDFFDGGSLEFIAFGPTAYGFHKGCDEEADNKGEYGVEFFVLENITKLERSHFI